MSDTPQEEKSMFKPYKGPAGGWGALKSVTTHQPPKRTIKSLASLYCHCPPFHRLLRWATVVW